MRWRILAIQHPRLAFARAALEEYLPRIAAFTPCVFESVQPRRTEDESTALLRASEGAFRVALDPGGRQPDSVSFARLVGQWELRPEKSVAFLIGGADGHFRPLLECSDFSWSLGPLTLQHELALAVVLEQFYRAWTIRRGLPYHRE